MISIGSASTKEGRVNKVMRITAGRIWLPFAATAFVGLAMGCGQIGGAGQCNGVNITGMCVTVDSIQPTDTVTGFGDTSDVDAFQSADCDGDPATSDPEKFGKHSAKVTISATLMTGVSSPPAPAFVTWTGYTIDFVASSTNLVSAPSLSSQAFAADNLKVNADTPTTWTFEFVPSQTKSEYANNSGPQWPPATYSAIYTFKGETQFKQDVEIKSSASFNIGNYDLCAQ